MHYPKFTSESVCSGHPDKICDAISDSILDAAYKSDPYSRVAVETLVTKNFVSRFHPGFHPGGVHPSHEATEWHGCLVI